MSFSWDLPPITGHELVDRQHQLLFSVCKAFLDKGQFGPAMADSVKLLSSLAVYVATHYQAEENLMKRYGFAGLAAHQAEHSRLRMKARASPATTG